MTARWRTDRSLVLGTAAVCAFGVAIGTITEADFVGVYAVSMALVIALIAWIDAHVHFSRWVLWGLIAWLLGHLVGGLWVLHGEVMYGHWIIEPVVRFDNVVHAWGFGVAGVATLEAMRPSLGTPSRVVVFVIVWFGGMATGALNEVIEWLGTKVQENTNVGGFENAMRDLASNAVGAAGAGWWCARPGPRE
jgi:hypothetical protein